MDPRSLRQLRGFWPDLADRLQDVVPGGCSLVRLRDEWRDNGKHPDSRTREVDMLPGAEGGGDLHDLLEDASIRGQGDGWRLAEENEDPPSFLLERGDEVLHAGRATSPLGGVETEVLRFSLEQLWPSNVEPPVDLSLLFTDVCARVLRLDQFPIHMEKDLIVDLGDLGRMRSTREKVTFASSEDVLTRVIAAGYASDGEIGRVWTSRSRSGIYEMVAVIVIDPERISLEILRDRPAALS
jgi:hypothetical protein